MRSNIFGNKNESDIDDIQQELESTIREGKFKILDSELDSEGSRLSAVDGEENHLTLLINKLGKLVIVTCKDGTSLINIEGCNEFREVLRNYAKDIFKQNESELPYETVKEKLSIILNSLGETGYSILNKNTIVDGNTEITFTGMKIDLEDESKYELYKKIMIEIFDEEEEDFREYEHNINCIEEGHYDDPIIDNDIEVVTLGDGTQFRIWDEGTEKHPRVCTDAYSESRYWTPAGRTLTYNILKQMGREFEDSRPMNPRMGVVLESLEKGTFDVEWINTEKENQTTVSLLVSGIKTQILLIEKYDPNLVSINIDGILLYQLDYLKSDKYIQRMVDLFKNDVEDFMGDTEITFRDLAIASR